jgi:hypothetical protein
MRLCLAFQLRLANSRFDRGLATVGSLVKIEGTVLMNCWGMDYQASGIQYVVVYVD